MFKKIFAMAVVTCLLSISVYAKNIQHANLSANIECNGCKNKIEKTLKSTNGVQKVNVNMKDQSVKVEYDKDVVSETQLVAAINNADAKLGAKSAKSCCSAKDAKSCNTKDAKSCSATKDAKPCMEGKKDGANCEKKCNK